MKKRFEIGNTILEVTYITGHFVSNLSELCKGRVTYLRGISRFVIGSYPTHLTPAFSHCVQAGILWSHRFLRNLQRLQAVTLRNVVADVGVVVGACWIDSGVSGDDRRRRLAFGGPGDESLFIM